MATVRLPRSVTTRPLEAERRTRHLRVIQPGERLRAPIRLTPRTGVVVTVLLFVALFAVAMSHALLIEGQSRLDRLDQQVAEEQARYERLQGDVAELSSPERILDEAREQGMVEPDESEWLPQSQSVSGDQDGTAPDTPATSYIETKPYMETGTP